MTQGLDQMLGDLQLQYAKPEKVHDMPANDDVQVEQRVLRDHNSATTVAREDWARRHENGCAGPFLSGEFEKKGDGARKSGNPKKRFFFRSRKVQKYEGLTDVRGQ